MNSSHSAELRFLDTAEQTRFFHPSTVAGYATTQSSWPTNTCRPSALKATACAGPARAPPSGRPVSSAQSCSPVRPTLASTSASRLRARASTSSAPSVDRLVAGASEGSPQPVRGSSITCCVPVGLARPPTASESPVGENARPATGPAPPIGTVFESQPLGLKTPTQSEPMPASAPRPLKRTSSTSPLRPAPSGSTWSWVATSHSRIGGRGGSAPLAGGSTRRREACRRARTRRP